MVEDSGAPLPGTGSRASTEPASSLGPPGFDPSREDCPNGCGWCGYECPVVAHQTGNAIYESDDRHLFCKHCGRSHILHYYMRGVGFLCSRDSDEHRSGEDPKGLSGDAMPARAEGIAQPFPATINYRGAVR